MEKQENITKETASKETASKETINNIVLIAVFVATGYTTLKNIKKVTSSVVKKIPFM